MADPTVIAALALDAAIGWPSWLHARIGHPVGLFARTIAVCERKWNAPARGERGRRLLGVLTVAILLLASGCAGWLVERAARLVPGEGSWILVAAAAWPGLAQRSLYDHVSPVLQALRRGDLAGARRAVAKIVGRETGALDAEGVAGAAVESLAESFCDGVVAPLFWLAVAGLPGLWAYKAINTADSLIGHPEPPLRAFGWAAARADDLANLVPARLAGGLLCVAGGGWRILWRDHGRHASPNAGWPEAAMAGALRVRLGGPVRYGGQVAVRPWIGDGRTADDGALARALTVYLRACMLMWAVLLGATWLG